MNIFLREMKANFKSLCFWSLGIVLLIGTAIGKFSGISGSGANINDIMKTMPKSLAVLFGFNGLDMSSIIGFIGITFLYIAIIAAIHAGNLGSSIIAKEEQDRTFEFLYVRPVTRVKIVVSKLMAALLNILIINVLTYISILGITKKVSSVNITKESTYLIIGLLFIQIIFFSIGFALSVILSNSKKASGMTASIVIICYLIFSLSEFTDKLELLKYISPFRYFSAVDLINKGIDSIFVVISLCIIVISILLTFVFHNKRDLRV